MKKGINVVYSDPVAAYIDGVMVTPNNKNKGEANLKNLGTIKGFTAWTYLDSIKAGKIKIRENPGFVPLLKMAIANRIDGAYLNVDVANYQLNNVMKQNGALVFDESLPSTKSNYHLSSVKHPQIIEEFNQFLKQESALVSKLKQKFNLSDK